ncbi:MAG: hypothetical protein Q9167_005299 [Letrouitia subvulpina]
MSNLLVVFWTEPSKDKNEGDMASTMASTLPMAATYLPLFMPPAPGRGTGTEAPAAAPPS